MNSKNYWTLSLIILALIALLYLFSFISSVISSYPEDVVVPDIITLAILVISIITLILYATKNKTGYYLNYVNLGIILIPSLLLILISFIFVNVDSTQASVLPLSTIGTVAGIIGAIGLLVSLLGVFSNWKSREEFNKK